MFFATTKIFVQKIQLQKSLVFTTIDYKLFFSLKTVTKFFITAKNTLQKNFGTTKSYNKNVIF